MPDFDAFERIYKAVMTADLSNEEGALRIFNLPESNKVEVVKGRKIHELIDFLKRSKSSLGQFFPNGAVFTSSDNNQLGKDLREVSTGTDIELKSGAKMTDANVGLEMVSWSIGDNELRLAAILSQGIQERREILLSDRGEQLIEASKSRTMDQLIDLFESKLSIGPAPSRLSHYFKSVATGFTQGREIQDLYLNTESHRPPLLLSSTWNDGLKLYGKPFLQDEKILITKIERTKRRIQVIAEGELSGRRAKLYPNFKNSWVAPNGVKFAARNWAKSASFHIWIR